MKHQREVMTAHWSNDTVTLLMAAVYYRGSQGDLEHKSFAVISDDLSHDTIHRSQGDTETQILVNLDTKIAIPLIHYLALSRVTTIEGLYITDLCQNKIAVSDDVSKETNRLQNEGQLCLSVLPLYKTEKNAFKLCFLNARSLHKHIND